MDTGEKNMRKVKKALVEEDANLKKVIKPLPEENFSFFTWTVFEEYEIMSRWEENERKPGTPVKVRYIAAKDPLGKRKEIEPLEDFPTLYNQFSKIDIKSVKSLFEIELDKSSWLDIKGIKSVEGLDEFVHFIYTFGLLTNASEERLDVFLNNLSNVKNCLTLYAALKNGTLKAENYYRNNLDEIMTERIGISDKKIFSSEEMEAKALKAITEHINKHINGCCPALVVKNKIIMPLNTCDTLLGAIYLQIYEKVSEKKELVQCEECGSLFFPKRKGEKYCPPYEKTKKSACLNRKLGREYRERNSKKKKKSVEMINSSI
jgi:hypothetical protein